MLNVAIHAKKIKKGSGSDDALDARTVLVLYLCTVYCVLVPTG